jgi:hypothetical protein
MKLQTGKITLAAVCASLLLIAVPSFAQGPTARYDIPFAFTAGSETLSAGQYDVSIDISHMVITLRPLDRTAISAFRITPGDSRPIANASGAMLRFEEIGGQRFLVGVWREGMTEGNKVTPSRKLFDMAKAAAPAGSAPTYVTVH